MARSCLKKQNSLLLEHFNVQQRSGENRMERSNRRLLVTKRIQRTGQRLAPAAPPWVRNCSPLVHSRVPFHNDTVSPRRQLFCDQRGQTEHPGQGDSTSSSRTELEHEAAAPHVCLQGASTIVKAAALQPRPQAIAGRCHPQLEGKPSPMQARSEQCELSRSLHTDDALKDGSYIGSRNYTVKKIFT